MGGIPFHPSWLLQTALGGDFLHHLGSWIGQMCDHQIVVLDKSRSIVIRRNETNLDWDQLIKKSTKVAYLMVSCAKAPHQNIYYDNSMKDQKQKHVYQQEDSRENLDTYPQNHCF